MGRKTARHPFRVRHSIHENGQIIRKPVYLAKEWWPRNTHSPTVQYAARVITMSYKGMKAQRWIWFYKSNCYQNFQSCIEESRISYHSAGYMKIGGNEHSRNYGFLRKTSMTATIVHGYQTPSKFLQRFM